MMASFYFVGIKGMGMASLAALLHEEGNTVSGCDVEEDFATSLLLKECQLHCDIGFDPSLLPPVDEVVYSTAYKTDIPLLEEARKRGIPVKSYNETIAAVTRKKESFIVCGTHGKTTVTAMADYLLSRPSRKAYPFFSIYGSSILGEEDLPPQGNRFFLLEGCEYKDHFLTYKARGAIVTSIAWDHPDYFKDEEAVYRSFEKFTDQIEAGGFLVICVDGKLTKRLLSHARRFRRDLNIIPYGFFASGPFRIRHNQLGGISLDFCENSFSLPAESDAWIDDMVGSSLFATAMLLDAPEVKPMLKENLLVTDEVFPTVFSGMVSDIASFPGTRGRMEKIGEEGGVLYYDDYAHHPGQIAVVLETLRKRHPGRHILVVFRPHTASRTNALFDDFVLALSRADKLVVEETFASARNDADEKGADSSKRLADALSGLMFHRQNCTLGAVIHADTDEKAASIAASWLMDGDICVTLGAGNSSILTRQIMQKRKES
jgi:UDP-N-acetylmuramate--alanine ligase